jgi:hypothetical protein
MKQAQSGMRGGSAIDQPVRAAVEALSNATPVRNALLMISVKVNSLFTLTTLTADLFMGAVRTRGTP